MIRCPTQHSLICTVTRLKKTVDRMEEEEKMMDRRLAEVQRKREGNGPDKEGILLNKPSNKEMEWAGEETTLRVVLTNL